MVEIAPAETVEAGGDAFQTIVAVLIAVVTIVGAVIAWRVSVLSMAAGDADFNSTNAVINREETQIIAHARFYQRYRAYTDFTMAQAEAALLEEALADAETAEAERLEQALINMADEQENNRFFFENRLLTLDGDYDRARDIGETVADARRDKDLNPAPHITSADAARKQIVGLGTVFVILSVSLLLFTIAEALHASRRGLRYALAGIAVILLGYCMVVAVLVETGGGA